MTTELAIIVIVGLGVIAIIDIAAAVVSGRISRREEGEE